MKAFGWIIYNGNLGKGKFRDHAEWAARTAKALGMEAKIVKNNELIMTIEDGEAKIKGKHAADQPNFVLFWDKDILLAKHLEKVGYRVYNSADAIEVCDNKALTFQRLADNGIPVPKTIFGPKIFPRLGVQDFSTYDVIADEIGFPMIIKELFGSFGEQVYFINNKEEMLEKVRTIGSKPLLFQEYITSSYGRDVRLNVVGKQVVASMLRISESDFRANLSANGKAYQYEPSETEKQIAIQASKLVGADFAGIDLLFGENGPLLCEINSNSHIKNIYDCTGIDVTKPMMQYIIDDLGV